MYLQIKGTGKTKAVRGTSASTLPTEGLEKNTRTDKRIGKDPNGGSRFKRVRRPSEEPKVEKRW